ncbi:hypothetical protein ABPG72_021915 [Tetrahymena utriculariae]
MSLNKNREREFFQIKDLAEKLYNEQSYKVLNITLYDQSYISNAIVLDDKNKEYNMKIINMFDGVNNIDNTIYQNAQKEVEVMKTFDHENVLKVVDSFELGYYFLIVTEKYECSLQQWLKNKKNNQLFLPQIVSFSDQLFQAIEYIHSKNKEARDIDLSTIMIDKNNQLKIVCNGYFNASIFKRIQNLQIKSEHDKISLFCIPNQQIGANDINIVKNILQIDKIKLREFDVLASIQVIYQLGGANLVDKFNRELLTNNLDEQFISTFNTIFESKNQKPPLIKDILKNIKNVKSDIWDRCQLAQKIFNSTLKMSQNPDTAIDLLLLCIEQYPSNSLYNQTIGDLYKTLQKYDDSAEAYQRCIQQDKENQTCQDSLLEVYKFKSTQEQLQKEKIIEIRFQKGNPQTNLYFEYTYQSKEVKKSNVSKRIIVVLVLVSYDFVLSIIFNLLAYIFVYVSFQICDLSEQVCYSQSLENIAGFSYAQYHFFKGCTDSEKVGYICSVGVADSLLQMHIKEGNFRQFYSTNHLKESLQYFNKCFQKTENQGYCYIHLADYYTGQLKYQQTLRTMDNCLKSLPDNVFCLSYLGEFYLQKTELQDYNKSIKYYQKCQDLYQLEACRDKLLEITQLLNNSKKKN